MLCRNVEKVVNHSGREFHTTNLTCTKLKVIVGLTFRSLHRSAAKIVWYKINIHKAEILLYVQICALLSQVSIVIGLKLAEDALNKHNLGGFGPGQNPFSSSHPHQPEPSNPYVPGAAAPPARPPPPHDGGGYQPRPNSFPQPTTNYFRESNVEKFKNQVSCQSIKISSDLSKMRSTSQDYEQLRQGCVSQGCLFKDPGFEASNRLLKDDMTQSIFSYLGGARMDPLGIEWLRPTVSSLHCTISFAHYPSAGLYCVGNLSQPPNVCWGARPL